MKSFHIREIDQKIHHQWKVISNFLSISMEQFAVEAIEEHCRRKVVELKAWFDSVEEESAMETEDEKEKES